MYNILMIRMLDSILDIIFPPRCQTCGKAGDQAICDTCLGKIKIINHRQKGAHCIASYEGVMKKALKKLKFKNKRLLAGPLGSIITGNVTLSGVDRIIPVPLHPSRLKERGFNQAELLLKALAEKHGVPLDTSTLIRPKKTKHQFDLGRHERHENIKDAFAVTGSGGISGKNILLFDDILTTGATVEECRKKLLESGAKTVYILALSRAE